LVNGLTTLLIGYIVLVPYSIVATLATLRRGHSWPVLHGVTPEMHLNRTWVNEPNVSDKVLAALAVPMCVLPGVGVLICWGILWKVRWRSGWVYKTTEIASFVAYFATIIAIGLWLDRRWDSAR
jgi:hypothetical protein